MASPQPHYTGPGQGQGGQQSFPTPSGPNQQGFGGPNNGPPFPQGSQTYSGERMICAIKEKKKGG